MAEDMAWVIRMAAVRSRERQKQRRRRHVRNEGPWEINFREECKDDEDGGRDAGQHIMERMVEVETQELRDVRMREMASAVHGNTNRDNNNPLISVSP